MLRITPFESAAALCRYFGETPNKALYYQSGTESPGVWDGLGAEYLRLAGEVKARYFQDLAKNLRPGTTDRLTQRTNTERIAAWDFTFSVPKSVSVMYACGDDRAIQKHVEAAVSDTMAEIETFAAARIRKGGRNSSRTTGNLTFAAYVHRTTRPVNGVPDPHLHVHVVVFNVTRDTAEKKWKALNIKPIRDRVALFDGAFTARLAKRLKDAGYSITLNERSFELSGLERYVATFSNRTRLINDRVEDLGIENPKAKDRVGKWTREAKLGNLKWERLQEKWRARFKPEELAAIIELGSPKPRPGVSSSHGQKSSSAEPPEAMGVPPEDQELNNQGDEQQHQQRRAKQKKRAKETGAREEWTQQSFESPPDGWYNDGSETMPESERQGHNAAADEDELGPSESRHNPGSESLWNRPSGPGRNAAGSRTGASSAIDGDPSESPETDPRVRVVDGRQLELPLQRKRQTRGGWWSRAGGQAERPDPKTAPVTAEARAALKEGAAKVFARDAVVSLLDLRAAVLEHGLGDVSPEEATAAIFQSESLKHVEIEGVSFFANRLDVILERKAIDFVRLGLHRCMTNLGPELVLSRGNIGLRDWDKSVLRKLFASRDVVTIVKYGGTNRRAGFATAALDGLAQNGRKTILLGATSRTCQTMEQRYLFGRRVQTVRHFLEDQRGDGLLAKPKLTPERDSVFWVEDAGSLGMREMADLLKLVKKWKCRAVLLGDDRSARSYEAGRPFALFRERGMCSIEHRVAEDERDAMENDLQSIDHAPASDVVRRMVYRNQASPVGDEEGVLQQTAERVSDAIASKRTSVAVAASHEAVVNICAAVRGKMREKKLLRKRETDVLQRKPVWLTGDWAKDRELIDNTMTIHFHTQTTVFKSGDTAPIMATLPMGGLLVLGPKNLPLTIFPKKKNISITRPDGIKLSSGDRIRLTRSMSKKQFGFRLKAGKELQVERVTALNIITKAGFSIPRSWGHFEYVYATTPAGIQGRRVDDVVVAGYRTAWSGLAREQIRSAFEACKRSFHCVVDDLDDLKASLDMHRPHHSATDLEDRPESVLAQHQRYQRWKDQQHERANDHRRTHHV